MPESIQKTIAQHEAAGTLDSAEYQSASEIFQNTFLWHNGTMPQIAETFNSDLYRTMWGPYEFYATGTLKDLSLWEGLGSLSMPILVCYGQFDWILPETAARVTQAQKVVFENCAHLSFIENQDLYVQTVKEFLDQISD